MGVTFWHETQSQFHFLTSSASPTILSTWVECAHDEELCNVQKCCPTKRTLIALHNKIQQFIEETTLATIVNDAQLIKPNFEDSKYEIAHLS